RTTQGRSATASAQPWDRSASPCVQLLAYLLSGVLVAWVLRGQEVQRMQRDPVGADFEEIPQSGARVAAAKAVCAEGAIGRVDPGADLVGYRAHVVAGGHHGNVAR